METVRSSRVAFEWLPMALLMIWWGIVEILPGLPRGTGVLGIAVILLGVNALRLALGGIVNRFSVTLGFLALATSLLLFSKGRLGIPLEIPIIPALLIVCGLIILGQGFASRSPSHDGKRTGA